MEADMLTGEAAAPALDIDPFDTAFLEDPYPAHHAMREAGPVFTLPRYGLFGMARHAEVHAALADWQTFSSARGVGIDDFARVKPRRPASIVLEVDPPLHTRTRTVMNRVLSPAAVKAVRERSAAFVDEVVAGLVRRVRFDAVTELAEPVPLRIFPDAVGVREDGRENLLPFSNAVFNSFGPVNALFLEASRTMEPVLAWILAQCERSALGPDGFGAKVYEAMDAGEIDATEAPVLVRSMLTAGLDTTVNAIGNTLLAFTAFPDAWRALRENPGLVKQTVDESLRFESPVQTFFRTTTREVDVAGTRIPEGTKVLLFLAAANRDPRKWSDPDRFDVHRRPIGHVGFGNGIHSCVGQLVARMEVELVLSSLVRQVATIELDGEPVRRLNNTVRGLSSLPLRVTPAG